MIIIRNQREKWVVWDNLTGRIVTRKEFNNKKDAEKALKEMGKTKKLKCKECKHNPMGICELCGREIPICYITGRSGYRPAFCPLLKKK